MNKKNIVIILLIITLSLITILNYSTIEHYINRYVQDLVEEYGYYAIGTLVFFLETVPQPFISALVPLSVGIIFELNIVVLLSMVIIVSITANYTAYFIGYYSSDQITKFFTNKKNYQKVQKWFEKYGKYSLSILALSPLPYLPIIGGIYKMKFIEFTIYAIIPRFIHFLIFGLLIYYVF